MLRNYFKISGTKNKHHENHIAKSVRFIASSSAGNGSSPGKQGTEDGTPTRTRLPRLETQQEKNGASPPFKKAAASTGGTSGSSGSAPADEDADHVTAAEILRQKEAEAKKKLKRLKDNADAEAPGKKATKGDSGAEAPGKKAAKGDGGAKASGKKAASSEGDTEASGKGKGKRRRKDATGVEL